MFCWKNVSSFCNAKATHIFSAKHIRILYIESDKTVNEMTLNELVKLTTLWTTGPRWARPICFFFFCCCFLFFFVFFFCIFFSQRLNLFYNVSSGVCGQRRPSPRSLIMAFAVRKQNLQNVSMESKCLMRLRMCRVLRIRTICNLLSMTRFQTQIFAHKVWYYSLLRVRF